MAAMSLNAKMPVEIQYLPCMLYEQLSAKLSLALIWLFQYTDKDN